MIAIQNIQCCNFKVDKNSNDSNYSVASWFTRKKEALIYHLFCGLYLIFLTMLMTLYIINVYKSKYITSNNCTEYTRKDHLFIRIFSCLFYCTLFLASVLVFTSLKYVSEYEHQSLNCIQKLHKQTNVEQRRDSQASKCDRVEEFIRRNSSVPLQQVHRNISDTSSSSPWLHSVRNEAYETHRQISTAHLGLPIDNLNVKNPEIVIEPIKD